MNLADRIKVLLADTERVVQELEKLNAREEARAQYWKGKG